MKRESVLGLGVLLLFFILFLSILCSTVSVTGLFQLVAILVLNTIIQFPCMLAFITKMATR